MFLCKYVFIRTHPKPDTSYFSPIIAVDVSTKTEPLGVSSQRCVQDEKLTKQFNLANSKWLSAFQSSEKMNYD